MKKLLKKTMVAALFLILGANMANAAFPTVKQNSQTATSSPAAVPATETASPQPAITEMKKAAPPAGRYEGGTKHKYVALILAAACGEFGVHSFYMGQKQKGFIQLGVSVVGLGLYIAGIASVISATDTVTIPALAIVGLIIFLGAAIWAIVDFFRILSGNLAPEEGFDD